MGMTIEDVKHCLKVMVDHEVCEECRLYGTTGTDHCEHDCVIEALNCINKYQMMQADYKARLKADLVAMLTDLQLEIEEMDSGCGWEGYRPTAQVIGLIQQKINELKAESEDQDE